jgi:phytoene dehydrogenase-like protein
LGGDVNALVAAHYLAREDCDVTLVHEHAAPVEDELEAGWIPPKIVKDLDLARYGLAIHDPDVWAVVNPDAEAFELSSDIRQSAAAIHKLSAHDAAKWPAFCERMHALARTLETIYTAAPPQPLARSASGLAALARVALRARRLGRDGMQDLFRLLPMPAADLLDDWFESDLLKGVLGAAAVMHLAQGPRSGGTVFNLLHHHVGSRCGVFRQPLTNIRSALARRTEVNVQSGTVARIEVRQGRAESVVLGSGEALAADAIVSGLPPARTLLELVDPAWLDPQLVRAVRNVRSRGVSAKILLTLDRDPRFTTLVIAPSLDYLERAYDATKYGHISAEPYIEARQTGQRGPGHFAVQVHVQYVPHSAKEVVWDTSESEKLGRSIIARIAEHVRGFAGWVIGQHVLTPDDIESIHGHPEGQEYDAELALDQVLWMRPVPELAQYRAPVEGLYLCGPAMHPGGGIAGAAGANAASIVAKDLKRRKR